MKLDEIDITSLKNWICKLFLRTSENVELAFVSKREKVSFRAGTILNEMEASFQTPGAVE